MLTHKISVLVIGDHFPYLEVKGFTSGAIVLLEFKDTKNNKPLCTAILLPADTEVSLRYSKDSVGYPILLPDGEVEVEFRGHVDTIKSQYWPLAFITSRSPTKGVQTSIHRL